MSNISTTPLPPTTASISSVIGNVISSQTSPGAPTPPPPTRTGNSGRDDQNYRPIASSAALYLYTFLATLVLLLTVSAAIVIRSFILRRRHRRLVEEAIRNGTWVPPTPTALGNGRPPRVDLSKKPVMWEAHLGGNEKDFGNYLHQEEKEWDVIKPVSAAYLSPASKTPDQNGGTKSVADRAVAGSGRNRSLGSRLGSLSRNLASGVRAIPGLFLDGIKFMLGLPSRASPANTAASTSSDDNGVAAADGSTTSQGNGDTSPPISGPDGGPPVVRVAVIIAMPHPPKPAPPSIPPIASSSSSSSNPLSPPSYLQRPPDLGDEEPLPVMEMGVAELVVVDHDADERRDALSRMDTKEPLGRDSASMTVEV